MVIAYHNSDGWYDQQMSPIVNQSNDPAHHALTHTSTCGTNAGRIVGGYQDRCGYGPRLPLVVISPYAKAGSLNNLFSFSEGQRRPTHWGS